MKCQIDKKYISSLFKGQEISEENFGVFKTNKKLSPISSLAEPQVALLYSLGPFFRIERHRT